MQTLLELLAAAAHAADVAGRPSEGVIAALRSSGLCGVGVPREFGGSGGDAADCNRRVADVASCDASVAIILFQHLSVAHRLLEHGTDDQKRRFLPPLASGAMLAASAWSEDGAGANKHRLSTTAVRRPDGSWVLHGRKASATGAAVADLILVLAADGDQAATAADSYGAAGQTFFLVDAPQVVARPSADLPGMRSSCTGSLDIEGCVVAAGDVLGPVGGAASVVAGVKRSGLTLGAVSVGIAEAAVRLARDAVAKQQPDSDQRRVASVRLAEMMVEVSAARALVDRAGRREPATVAVDTLAAKVFASEAGERVCRDAQQVLGGRGYARTAAIDRLARDARAIALMGPVNELALILIAAEVMS